MQHTEPCLISGPDLGIECIDLYNVILYRAQCQVKSVTIQENIPTLTIDVIVDTLANVRFTI